MSTLANTRALFRTSAVNEKQITLIITMKKTTIIPTMMMTVTTIHPRVETYVMFPRVEKQSGLDPNLMNFIVSISGVTLTPSDW